MDTPTPEPAAPRHLVFQACDDWVPFATDAGCDAAVRCLRQLAVRGEAVVLAFAIRPARLEVLLAPVVEADWPRRLRTAFTRAVNRALGRTGPLLERAVAVNVLAPDDDWVPLADGLEASLGPDGLDSPATSASPAHAAWVRQQQPASPPPVVPRPPAQETVGEVIAVADVPTVIQLDRVADGIGAHRGDSGGLDAGLIDYVVRWFLGDRRTLAVARAVLGPLAQADAGGGFFVSGLYGAGKSHLLAVLALVAEFHEAREALFAAHPGLQDLTGDWPKVPLLVVPVALDGCSPRESLEEVVFTAAQQALACHGVSAPLAEADWVIALATAHLCDRYQADLDRLADGDWRQLATADPAAAAVVAQRLVDAKQLPLRFGQSRVERLGRLQEIASGAGFRGTLVLLDELSVFLGSRDRQGLEADAGFLQFLGQRTAASPLWIVAAMQKQFEDIGPVDYYTLRQVKHRYETRLTLPLSAAREVLRQKVLPARSAEALTQAVEACLATWTGGQALADFSGAALRDVYPLHPLAATALEACADSFLGKTRSVIEFAALRVRGDALTDGILDRPVTALLCCDELWDHFARDLVPHPDVQRYHEQFVHYYEQNLPSLLEPGDDTAFALRLIKLLAILRLAGLDRGVRDLTAALVPYTPAAREEVAGLLELLRTRGPFVTVERQTGAAGDRYRVDLEYDVNQTIRRRVSAIAAALAEGDSRLTGLAVEASQSPEFPLATALHERTVTFRWCHTPRSAFVALTDLRRVSRRELTNQAALLAGPEVVETLYVWIAEPQRLEAQAAAFEQALAGVPDPRWRQALAAWLPREATAEERQVWVDDVAHQLLQGDPTLAAGGLGAALLARLDETAELRAARLAGLMQRLYAEGFWLTAGGRSPVAGGDWHAIWEQQGDRLLAGLYPDFAALQPLGDYSEAVSNRLIERLIMPGEAQATPQSVLAQEIERLAVPLGVAVGEAGQYRLVMPDRLAAAALAALPERETSVANVERCWALSTQGLDVEQSRVLLLASLVRTGHLVATDDQGEPAALGVPLRSCLATVRPAPLVDEEDWAQVQRFAGVWLPGGWPSRSRAGQQQAWDRLLAWRQAVQSQLPVMTAAVERFACQAGQELLQWREVLDHGRQLAPLAEAIQPGQPAAVGLAGFAHRLPAPSDTTLRRWYERHQTLRDFAARRADQLAAAWRFLREVSLPPGSDLERTRDELLTRLGEVDQLVEKASAWLGDYLSWRRRYTDAYQRWHAEQHAPERFRGFETAHQGWPLRLLSNLTRLACDDAAAAQAVEQAIRVERRRQCSRVDLTHLPEDAGVCPECRLALGEPLVLRPLDELEDEARSAVATLLRALQRQRDPLLAGLAERPAEDPRSVAARALLKGPTEPAEGMVALTSYAVIDLLNNLLNHPVVGHRSVAALTRRLAGHQFTRRQVEEQFGQWLDPEGRLDEADRLQIDP